MTKRGPVKLEVLALPLAEPFWFDTREDAEAMKTFLQACTVDDGPVRTRITEYAPIIEDTDPMTRDITEFSGPNRYLSNFWMAPVELEGIVYPSTEHAFQAAKSLDPEVRKRIAALAKPSEAKAEGKKIALRPDWESVKTQYMRFLVWAKFSTHPELKAKLLSTGTARLVEGNTWGDTVWGVCNGQGENRLGLILEEVRAELQKTAPRDKVFLPGPGRIFVFGSNLAGVHGGGAAKTAHEQYGAVWGKGQGEQGMCYAIPTKDQNLRTLPLAAIESFVKMFIAYAGANPHLYFFVTRIGCGLAGYTDDQIAPLFIDAPDNCELPEGWD